MPDELLTALLPGPGLRVVLATTTVLCREARDRHRALPASAAVLASALTGAALLSGLQKEETRVSLQLECDGPVRGFYADATTSGALRGYVKNASVQHLGAEGPYRWRSALGNRGFLSCLRELGRGEFYRSSVELEAFEPSLDLERYFQASEQVDSVVGLAMRALGAEPLGAVAGLLVQSLPDGDRNLLQSLRERVHGGAALAGGLDTPTVSPAGLLHGLFDPLVPEVLEVRPLVLRCRCSRERVKNALRAMGRTELEDLLAKEGHADARCEFCTTEYVIAADEIRSLLEA
jgi:molecular chaperone Hsp33